MKQKVLYFILASLAVVGVSCSEESKFFDFTVEISAPQHEADTVTLLVYEPVYHHQRVIGAGRIKDGALSLSGTLTESKIAVLHIGRKKYPLYFILDGGTTAMRVDKEKVVVQGGEKNHEYFSTLSFVEKLLKDIELNSQRYSDALTDTTITEAQLSQYQIADSVLRDSVQNLCKQQVERADYIGILFKEKYGHLLRSNPPETP